MVSSLGSAFYDKDCSVCIVGSFCDDFQKQVFRDVVRTGIGDKKSTWAEEFYRSQVYFFVAAAGGGHAGPILGKGRGIEDDHVEAAASVVVLFEDIEGVCFAE